MEIDDPIWYLKIICPNCEQGSSLAFITCPHCENIVIQCQEEGSVFPDPGNISLRAMIEEEDAAACPHCKKASLATFTPASGEAIQQLGIAVAEYS